MSDMKKLLESIDAVNMLDETAFDFDPERKIINTEYKQYHLSEITPQMMYQWVKAGHVNYKMFDAWAEDLYERNPEC